MSEIIYFYTPRGPYGFMSNYSPHGILLDHRYWPTVEHYYQAQKFAGTPHMETVRLARHPGHAKNLSRRQDWPLRPDWETVKVDVMRRAVLRKFWTHADIRRTLLETGNRPLVENAPADFFWGCGADGSGRNMLGLILMEVRGVLRARESAGIDVDAAH